MIDEISLYSEKHTRPPFWNRVPSWVLWIWYLFFPPKLSEEALTFFEDLGLPFADKDGDPVPKVIHE